MYHSGKLYTSLLETILAGGIVWVWQLTPVGPPHQFLCTPGPVPAVQVSVGEQASSVHSQQRRSVEFCLFSAIVP